MREIKYRIWNKQAKRWMEFEEVFIDEEGEVFIIEERSWAMQCYMHKENITERVNIVWFTGLKDKNDKEIYESDIVNVNHYGGTPKYEKVQFYTTSGFAGLHPFTDSGHHWSAKNCEVIGNIFENPELIPR